MTTDRTTDGPLIVTSVDLWNARMEPDGGTWGGSQFWGLVALATAPPAYVYVPVHIATLLTGQESVEELSCKQVPPDCKHTPVLPQLERPVAADGKALL